jgi:hypothetical protein
MPRRNKTVIGFVAWRRKRKIEKWPQSQRGTAEHDSGDPPLADQVTVSPISAFVRLNRDAADHGAFNVSYAPDSGSKADIPFSPSRAQHRTCRTSAALFQTPQQLISATRSSPSMFPQGRAKQKRDVRCFFALTRASRFAVTPPKLNIMISQNANRTSINHFKPTRAQSFQ